MVFMVYPLEGNITGRTFEAVRMVTAEMGGMVSNAALCLGCFFFGIKLIKMYYDVVSDEQHGGFGGIRVWDILRPILILLLIAGYSWVLVKPVDTLASAAAGVVGAGKDMSISGGINKLREIGSGFSKEWDEVLIDKEKSDKELATTASTTGADITGIKRTIMNLFNSFLGFFKMIPLWLDGFVKGFTKGLGTFVDSILILVFDLYANILRIFADMMLTMLVLVGPLMLAFSIFDRWKGYVWTFIGQYVQFSLWKPIVAVILWATMSVSDLTAGTLCDVFRGNDNFLQNVGAFFSAVFTSCIAIIAGIQCLKKVPEIASSLISLAAGVSGIGDAAGKLAGIAGGATGMALGAAGRGAVSGIAQANGAIQGMRQGVGAKVGAEVGKIGGEQFNQKVGAAIGKVGKKLNIW